MHQGLQTNPGFRIPPGTLEGALPDCLLRLNCLFRLNLPLVCFGEGVVLFLRPSSESREPSSRPRTRSTWTSARWSPTSPTRTSTATSCPGWMRASVKVSWLRSGFVWHAHGQAITKELFLLVIQAGRAKRAAVSCNLSSAEICDEICESRNRLAGQS